MKLPTGEVRRARVESKCGEKRRKSGTPRRSEGRGARRGGRMEVLQCQLALRGGTKFVGRKEGRREGRKGG